MFTGARPNRSRPAAYTLLLSACLALSSALAGESAAPAAAPAAGESAAHASAPLPTGAKAKHAARPRKQARSLLASIQETFRRGGKMMYVLLACSVIGFTFFLERLVNLRRGFHVPRRLDEEVLAKIRTASPEAGLELVRDNPAALARVLHGLLARQGANRQELERALEDDAGRVLWDLRLNIRPVGIVASIAPLIGLLGTVFGMIAAFQEAAELGMDDPKNFASGIYVALYTTAFGLTIAIPFLAGYHYLRGKADVIMREVEDIALRFVNELHRQAG